jgi:predicted permease
MAGWGRDLAFVMRRLRGAPGIVAAVVVSIGIGIAANATIFAMVSRFVLRAAPVGDPAGLVSVHTTHDGERCCNAFSWPTYVDVRDQAQSFSGVAAFDELIPASINGKGDPERVWGQATTTNYFDVAQLDLPGGMTVGRGFREDEDHAQVIVLGHRLWLRRFAGDRSIVGKAITLSGRPYTVVGVAPTGYRGIDFLLDAEFWVPLGNGPQLNPTEPSRELRGYHWLQVIARVKPGVTHEEADAELRTMAARFAAAYPETDKGNGFRFEQAGSLPPRDKGTILTFLAALSIVVLLVLCIAGANVANLLLAQAAERGKEMAVRLTLGATRGALQRLMLMESVILALGGGLFGFALSLWATQALSAFHLPAPVPLDLNIHTDWRVLLYTFALSVGAGVVLGIAPAWAASHPILSSALKGESGLVQPGRRWSLRSVLVVSQVAMSVVLLCATGLFLRSMQHASGIDIGFRSRGVLITSVDPRVNGYSAEQTLQFLKQLRERVSGLPGVASVVCTDLVPLSDGGRSDGFHVAGQPSPPDGGPIADLYMATGGYFDVLGIPRLAGRDFGNESPKGPRVAIVNQEFVAKILGGREAIGQRVDGGGVTYEIVGVVKDLKSRTLGEAPRPILFRSLEQSAGNDPAFLGYSVLVRTGGGDYSALESAVRQEIHAIDPAMATYNEATMEEHLRDALFLPRLAATLFGVFGVCGVLLAAVGLYGVTSYAVSRRTREIGIRMALGAQVAGVQKMIVGQGMKLAGIALVLGLGAAFGVARLFGAFLYGVRTDDAVTFVGVPILLGIVVLVASWIPARRAARVDPMVALRWE